MKCFYCGHELLSWQETQEVEFKSFKGIDKGIAHKDLTMCISGLNYDVRMLKEKLDVKKIRFEDASYNKYSGPRDF